MIEQKPRPHDFTITRWRLSSDETFPWAGYHVEIDGLDQDPVFEEADDALCWCKRKAKNEGWTDCGITEAWDKGRQWIQGVRDGWPRHRTKWIEAPKEKGAA